MLKRILTRKKYFKNIYKEQKGITGLETAIILIAFVVVAAVFAYTVLSAGLFSTQKSQQAVYSGLQESQSTIEVKGGVVSNGVAQLDNCDIANWTVAHGAVATENTIKLEGANSLKITPPGSVENIAAHSMVAKSFLSTDVLSFWAKLANVATDGEISFAISPNADLSSPTSSVVITQGTPDTAWHKYTIDLSASDDTSVYYGVTQSSGSDTNFVYIDDIEISDANLYTISDPMLTFANSAVFTLSLAAGGDPIDFTTGADTNGDGVIETHTNKVTVNYSDAYQQVNDLAWTVTKLGSDDGDNLLSGNEKYQLTVDLTYINQHAALAADKIGANHDFTLEIKPPTGAVLTIARTMPPKIQTINNLN